MSRQESCSVSPTVVSVYQTWDDIRRELEQGEVIHVDKGILPHPGEAGLRRTALTIKGFSRVVYNDSRERNSLRVYDHGSYYEATVVKHNPDAGVIAAARHAVSDSPKTTALAATIGYGLYQLMKPRESESYESSGLF